MTTLGDLMGKNTEDDFDDFDLGEIQDVLANLATTNVLDLAHAEALQQQSLRGADIISEYLGKLVKTVTYLESKYSSLKNRTSLEFVGENGKATSDMKKWAGESNQGVEDLSIKIGRAKGAKALLERKYDLLIKSHHFYKEISLGLKRSILGIPLTTDKPSQASQTPWEIE